MAKKTGLGLKTVYHAYFEGDNIGEADGFFEIKNGKLSAVTGWSLNDAHWRYEYMQGLIGYFGGIVEPLPKKYQAQAEKLLLKLWNLG